MSSVDENESSHSADFGIRPYSFEPSNPNRIPQDDDDEPLSDGEIEPQPVTVNEDDLPPLPSDFCKCENCDQMPTRKESVCCQDDEYYEVRNRINKRRKIDMEGNLIISFSELKGQFTPGTKSVRYIGMCKEIYIINTFW